jgi:hypothetical protein
MAIVYPSLNSAAETASAAAQARLLQVNRWQLYLLTGTAFISGWNPADPTSQRVVALLVCLLMLAALCCSVALQQGAFDAIWFDCRAAAETVKSATWYYVMSPAGDANARKTYEDETAQIFVRLPGIETHLVACGGTSTAVTESMEATRALPIDQKVEAFRAERAVDQLDWYTRKSAWNGAQEMRWRVAILIVEFGAIAYAVIQLLTLWSLNLVGGIAALSAAGIAWLQTKRFGDLHKTYAVAARDLQAISDRFQAVASEEDVMRFVTSVESAVSREHSIWLKRRMA